MLARRLAAVAAVAVAAVGVLATSTAATAAGSKCVALVVDFSHVGGSVSSACVTVPTKASSSDVLATGHHKVTFDPRYGNDFICAIDGVPANGCHATDDTHYWVYYHRAPDSTAWHVSQEGAGTYKPANTSTDGWVYDNGSSSAPAPRDVPYKSICTNPPPTPTQSQTAVRPIATLSPPQSASSRAASPPAVAVSTASPVASSVPSTLPSATASARFANAAHRHAMYRVPLVLVLGLLAAAGLGAAAIVRMRR